MQQRHIRTWIALAALAAQVLAPFAAHASAKPGGSFGDLCSASAKALPATASPAGPPTQGSDRHGADHCASCPGGSAVAAIIPPAMATMLARTPACALPHVERDAPELLFLLLPPSQAPPGPA